MTLYSMCSVCICKHDLYILCAQFAYIFMIYVYCLFSSRIKAEYVNIVCSVLVHDHYLCTMLVQFAYVFSSRTKSCSLFAYITMICIWILCDQFANTSLIRLYLSSTYIFTRKVTVSRKVVSLSSQGNFCYSFCPWFTLWKKWQYMRQTARISCLHTGGRNLFCDQTTYLPIGQKSVETLPHDLLTDMKTFQFSKPDNMNAQCHPAHLCRIIPTLTLSLKPVDGRLEKKIRSMTALFLE